MEYLYNLELEGGPLVNDHSVIINGLIVCTLGKDCGFRIATGWPKADALFGTGYWFRGDSAWLNRILPLFSFCLLRTKKIKICFRERGLLDFQKIENPQNKEQNLVRVI